MQVTTEQLETFLTKAQAHVNADYSTNFEGDAPTLSIDPMTERSKYAKIVKDTGQRSLWGFVELSTGNLLTGSWKAPRKSKSTCGHIDEPFLPRTRWMSV